MERSFLRLKSFKNCSTCKEPFVSLSSEGYYFNPEEGCIICHSCKAKHKDFETKKLVDLQHLKTCKYFVEPKNSIDDSDRKTKKPNYHEMKFSGEPQYRNADANNSNLSAGDDQPKSNSQSTHYRHYGAANMSQSQVDSNSSSSCGDQLSNLNTSNQLENLSEDLSREDDRVRTFQNPNHPWPLRTVIDEKELARVGFFYLGLGDRVQCYFCNGILRKWSLGDQPFQEHKKHFPDCPLVQKLLAEQTRLH